MGELIALILSLCTLLSMGVLLLIPAVILGAMFVLPFVWRAKWAGWTAGTVAEAYDNVALGATRGPIQVIPGSYLWERSVAVEKSPAETIDALEAYYRKTPLLTILGRDEDGLMVDQRIPSGLGLGWIVVLKVEPKEGGGATVHDRHRSTFCIAFPVLTFFLALSLHLHQERILREACA